MELMLMVLFIGLLILATGVTFRKMEDLFLTEPLLAMALGVLLSPEVTGILSDKDPSAEFDIMKVTTEFTMAMAPMAAALRLPKAFFRKNPFSQSTIVIPGMILMSLSSAILLSFIFSDLSFVECLLIGAIITPTDPLVASTIVTGDKAEKYLQQKIRNSLTFEAGSKDGLVFPVVMVGIYLVE